MLSWPAQAVSSLAAHLFLAALCCQARARSLCMASWGQSMVSTPGHKHAAADQNVFDTSGTPMDDDEDNELHPRGDTSTDSDKDDKDKGDKDKGNDKGKGKGKGGGATGNAPLPPGPTGVNKIIYHSPKPVMHGTVRLSACPARGKDLAGCELAVVA